MEQKEDEVEKREDAEDRKIKRMREKRMMSRSRRRG